MPNFYLYLEHDGVRIEDPDGSDLPDLHAAHAEALAAARDLWAQAIVRGEDLSDRRFIIFDEHGTEHLAFAFIDALPEGLRRRLFDARPWPKGEEGE